MPPSGNTAQLSSTKRSPVVIGSHHDPASDWARPPRLRSVVELRSETKPPRVWPWYLTMLLLGFAVGLVWR